MVKKATALTEAKQSLKDRNIPIIEIGEFGYVALIGHYGSDNHIVETTRITSSSKNTDVESLIRYLMRKRHTSPFEFCSIDLEIALPIFCERQMIRHRMSHVNEVSARYAQLPGEVWDLPVDRIVYAPESNQNRQGSGNAIPESQHEWFKERYNFSTQNAVNTYEEFMDKGMAPEIARTHLPLSTMTRKRWQCDLHNLLHFLGLRMDPHAQKEIRDYADAIAVFTKQLFPISFKAFEDYRMNAVTFSAMEIEILKLSNDNHLLLDVLKYYLSEDKSYCSNYNTKVFENLGKTELIEFKSKLERLV